MQYNIDVNSLLRRVVGAFPPPEFLSMPAAAIDISDTSIKYLDTQYTTAGYIPRNFSSVPLPEGVVSGGAVRDIVALGAALSPLRKKYKRKFAFISLPEELAYLFTVRIPHSEDTDIKEAVEFALGEHVPVALQDAIFDYDIIAEGSRDTEVSVTVYERKVVEGYIEALQLAGFEVRACELEARSVVGSVVPGAASGVSMVVDFGRNRTGITIARGKSPIFTTTVHVGGESITEAIMKYKTVTAEEADILKREVGLTQKEDEKLRSILVDAVHTLVGEIERHYQFWGTRRDERGRRIDRINNIYLCGGAAGLLGLTEYMTEELRVSVHTANVWQNMFDTNEYVPPMDKTLSWQYATVAGLVLIDSAK